MRSKLLSLGVALGLTMAGALVGCRDRYGDMDTNRDTTRGPETNRGTDVAPGADINRPTTGPTATAPTTPTAAGNEELSQDRMKTELERLDREFASLKTQMDRRGDAVKAEYRQSMTDIENQISKLRDQISDTSSEGWATARQQVKRSLDDIDNKLQDLKDKMG